MVFVLLSVGQTHFLRFQFVLTHISNCSLFNHISICCSSHRLFYSEPMQCTSAEGNFFRVVWGTSHTLQSVLQWTTFSCNIYRDQLFIIYYGKLVITVWQLADCVWVCLNLLRPVTFNWISSMALRHHWSSYPFVYERMWLICTCRWLPPPEGSRKGFWYTWYLSIMECYCLATVLVIGLLLFSLGSPHWVPVSQVAMICLAGS